ncbi:hypothetical protein B0H13DRAFT_2680090 [Mycena leptocephala]|nr:hypothetical protein B0H13DRAFT_2680090 [Mycena leptocephala]
MDGEMPRRVNIPQLANYQTTEIASVRTITKTRAEKRRAILIDLAIALGIPQIPLRHCYNIFEIIGCLSETYETPSPSSSSTSLPSSSAPSPSSNVHQILLQLPLPIPAPAFASTILNLNRYIRHGARCHPPAHRPPSSYALTSPSSGSRPGFRGSIPTHGERADAAMGAGGALLFFAYFGFADEAIKNYCGAFQSIAKRMGYTTGGLSGLTQHLNSPTFPPPAAPRSPSSSEKTPPKSGNRSTPPISGMEYDAEKAGTLTLADVGGMLPDYKTSDYSSSPTSSSASSDTESVHSAREEIEVSSLHRASVHIPGLLEPAHTRPVSVRNAGDIV